VVSFIGETGEPRENHQPAISHWQTLSHNVVLNTPHEQDSNFSGVRNIVESGVKHHNPNPLQTVLTDYSWC
jgi:hypothetical protein